MEKAPEHILNALCFDVSLEIKDEYDGIVISGMGGSAIAGDMLIDLFCDSLEKRIYVNRGYRLPSFIGKKMLFLAISYSGNTEETLAALGEAEKRGMPIICLSSGGKLKEIAEKKKYPFVSLPLGFEPRAAFYSIFTLLIRTLEEIRFIPSLSAQFREAAEELKKLKNDLGSQKPEKENELKKIAQQIKGKIPVIFSSNLLTGACGLRLKNQLNENSKLVALLSLFPEIDHNEIVGFAGLEKNGNPFSVIILRDPEESGRLKKRIEITKKALKPAFEDIIELFPKGNTKLSRFFSFVFMADLLSVYVAILNGVNPSPVDAISRLKMELKD